MKQNVKNHWTNCNVHCYTAHGYTASTKFLNKHEKIGLEH